MKRGRLASRKRKEKAMLGARSEVTGDAKRWRWGGASGLADFVPCKKN